MRALILRALMPTSLASLALLATAALAQEAVRIPWGSDTLPQEARAIAPASRLILDGLRLEDGAIQASLELERIEVFAPGTRIVVHGEAGISVREPPSDIRFRGRVMGEPGSSAVVSVLEDGTVRGVISSAGSYWILGGDPQSPEDRGLLRKAAAEPGGGGFRCANDGLEAPSVGLKPVRAALSGKATPTKHTALVAIETDYELYQRFGSESAMTSYIGDLVAYASGIYDDELDTNLVIDHLSVWTTAADPWAQTDAGCGLLEFGKYWHENRAAVGRTIAHFLSGKSGGSGIAWVGVLCRGDFSAQQSQVGGGCAGLPDSGVMGGAYGFTKGISGSFNPAAPNVVWDIVAFAHEVGHNFDSPHTHCYEGIGGMASAVDECYVQGGSGCFSGETTSLPSGCPGAGQHCATIMSYCHLGFGGGLSNIAFSFGRSFPYGVLPDRVPDRMRSHVEATAACMARIDPEVVFADGFETGSTRRWSAP